MENGLLKMDHELVRKETSTQFIIHFQ